MERISKLTFAMKERGVESIFITSQANVYYISNYYTDPHERLVAIYLDQTGRALIILPEMEKANAIQSGWTQDIISYNDQENPWELFKKYLLALYSLPESMAIEKNHMTVDRQELLQTILPKTTTQDATNLLSSLRVIKDKQEYKLLKQAACLADYGVKIGIDSIQEGKSELEVVADIEYALKKQGIREMSFSTMVLAGNKTASPHGSPSLDKIKYGDLILFDLGVVFEGYCSDITRTVAFQSITPEQNNIYQTVLAAQMKAIETAKINTPIGDLDTIAREHIINEGYGDFFTHRIGHGIGIDVHEFPSLTSNNTLLLKEGMSFTLEPGVYIPNLGGVRIEDDIYMTNQGPEILTTYPKKLQIIG
ncbi:Xaa-Pro peptidase family protein [Aquibacillus sp. LR5S19]|uniref:Xaa-Pro peptidase family protein n=2 Tax=Aquibacillus rhizosphaerae TaxID=3051431 RepID=A0ABT7L640_9BACI|nr:Xaa-Pro peptidase family protein [Aquibacillus sp. LR5S19]MDL4841331.1 Xaa-Pro peptidase family protein [Aquibacillus sp. LR5S19]